MKIAILSDIHSNIYALERVLEDVESRSVDHIFNLGDILYGPIAPQETFERLQVSSIVTVRGNQDRQIYEATSNEINGNPTLRFILEDLDTAALAWMKGLPPSLAFNDEVFLCHGTPSSDLVYLLEDVSDGLPRVRAEHEIVALIDGRRESLIVCGHTHIPRVVTTSSQQIIVNPGSVGLPAYSDELPAPHKMENYSPHASYAVVEKCDGAWQASLIKLAYDFERAAQKAELRGREDWANALRTGRSNA